jgi:putative tricarboxylic transport membrane protein
MTKIDRISAAAFILIALVFWSQTGHLQYNGYIFPRLIIIMFAIFSVIMFIQPSFTKEGKKEQTAIKDDLKYITVVIALVLLWIGLLDVLGFIVSSVVSLTILTTILEHHRLALARMTFTTAVYILLLIVFWFIFHKLLLVPLPTGYFI